MEIIRPKIDQPEKVHEFLKRNSPFQHPDLAVVSLSGSKNSKSSGPLSDIDITTVMKPERATKVDTEAIITLSNQIRRFAFSIADKSEIIPVVIATIRLEEAQTALAEAINPGKIIVPIHWLHYPSLTFAAVNEPPELFLGLIEGKTLFGEKNEVIHNFQALDKTPFMHLGGLDWLTDSFRVFLVNRNDGEFPVFLQPDSFLKRLATHNLEYFWKWRIIRPLIERQTGTAPVNWKEADQVARTLPKDFWQTALQVRKLRHQGVWAQSSEIIALHKETFDLWPI